MNKIYDAHMRYMESKGLDKETALALLIFAKKNNFIENDDNNAKQFIEEIVKIAETI